MTLIERQSRFEIMRLLDGRDADSMAYALREVKTTYGHVIQSITADNGPEFAFLEATMGDVADIYFAHPYTSCERGTNEVHNHMIRQDFPKGQSLDLISPAQVASAESKLNHMPRKILGYRTSAELFAIACG